MRSSRDEQTTGSEEFGFVFRDERTNFIHLGL